MKRQEITVTIDQDGQATVSVSGIDGPTCRRQQRVSRKRSEWSARANVLLNTIGPASSRPPPSAT